MFIKICSTCGKEFIATNPRYKYCSEECRLRAYRVFNKKKYYEERDKIVKVCPICGKEFKHSRSKYCSKECFKESRRRASSQYYQNHLEECRAKSREYSKKHKKELKEYLKKYYRDNRDKLLARARDKQVRKARRNKYLTPMEKCRLEHDLCFSCPTLDGECLYN